MVDHIAGGCTAAALEGDERPVQAGVVEQFHGTTRSQRQELQIQVGAHGRVGAHRDAVLRDLESYISAALVDELTMPNVRELPPRAGLSYVAFIDAAGGQGRDSFCAPCTPQDGWRLERFT